MQGLQNSVRNLNFIPMESTETPLQLHSNNTPTPLHGVEMELNFKNCVEFQKLCRVRFGVCGVGVEVELEWEWS